MNKLSELLKARAAKFDELEKLVEKMGAADYAETPEDNKLYDELKSAVADLDGKVARFQDLQKAKGATAIVLPGQERRNDDGPRIQRVRSAGLKNIKADTSAAAEEKAYRFGQFVLASQFGNEKAAGWCRDNGIVIQRAQSEGVNTQGGFLVPDEFSTTIIDLRDAYGVFRRLCQVMPMGRDTLQMPRRTGGLTAYAVGEATGLTQSTAAWDAVTLVAKKIGVLTLLSSELDEDAAVNIGDILAGEIAYAMGVYEDTVGFNGDGSSTHHGIQGIITKLQSATYAGSTVDAASGHDTLAEIDAADLAGVMAKLPNYVYVRGRPAWHCTQAAWALVFQRLLIASGGATVESVGGNIRRSYLGFPVEINTSMISAQTAQNDKVLVMFGDVNMAVTMGDRRGMTLARSTEYKFAEDQIALKATERFDINVHDVGSSTAAGPVIGLLGTT